MKNGLALPSTILPDTTRKGLTLLLHIFAQVKRLDVLVSFT